MENVEDKLKDLVSTTAHDEPVYLTHSKIDTNKIIINNGVVHSRIEQYWRNRIHQINTESDDPYYAAAYLDQILNRFEDNFNTFRKEIQSEVNYLVKEFECKKSADAYSRATTARTGVLDCTKLHTYKYNEDLFRKVTTLPEGKNHGLVFVLDWSGSMCEVLSNTVKQLLSLVMFCDKVGIPFDVYTFTNDYNQDRDPYRARELGEVNTFDLGHNFNMVNILTSKVNRKVLTEQMKRVYMIGEMFSTGEYNAVPTFMNLSGTPLNEAILTLHQIVPQFQERNNVQKVHTIILTDGEAGQTKYVKASTYEDCEKHVARIPHMCSYLRNRKTGVTSKLEGFAITKHLLTDLRETFPGSSFTGFRILESGSGYFIRQVLNYDQKKMAEWKKNKSISLEDQGYTKFFIIQSNTLKSNTEFDVDDGATKAKIKSSFVKSLKGKKNNKRILGEFVGMIA